VANNIMRPWNDEDRRVIRGVLDHAHARFIDIVHQGRKSHLSLDEVRALSDGSIYSAEQARDKKLIDEVGYLDAAIMKAKTLAGTSPTTNPAVKVIHPARHLSLLGSVSANPPRGAGGITSEEVRKWAIELSAPRLEYRFSP